MEGIVEILVSAFPWLQGVVDVADIVITAIPAWGVPVGGSIVLAIGGLYLLQHFKLLPNLIKGDDWNDDNW